MNVKRLLLLADFLLTVPDSRFCLQSWIATVDGEKIDFNSCGTVACAIGWATTIRSFNEEGFVLREDVPIWRESEGWYAVSNFFDIKFDDAYELFGDQRYLPNATPTDVSNRIKEFCNAA